MEVELKKFVPRPYQIPICKALEVDGYKKLLIVMPRRSGKDLVAWNLMIRAALRKPGIYFYCLPTFRQCKLVIWDSITNDGDRFLDYIPKELIAGTNSQELKIRLINGSIIQLIGSDSYDTSLVGTNFRFIIFSEWALSDERAYHFARPVLNANDGTVMFLSTPRGKNHLFTLFSIAEKLDDWYTTIMTIEETKHIPIDQINKEIESGEMSYDLAQQEYWCSFSLGVEGAFYSKYIDDMRLYGRIGMVPWQPDQPVNTAWDIGVSDSTVIIFFQYFDNMVRIIDVYVNNKQGLEHYIKEVQNKPYVYNKHIAPFDMKVKEFGSGVTRLEKAANLGIRFVIAKSLFIQDGIEAVRTMLPKTMIDETRCSKLIVALEHYRQEYDHKNKVYKNKPLHDWSCFVGETPILTRNGIRQIMSLTDKDEILTLRGWYKCSNAKKTGTNAPLVEVTFSDGMKVKCTPEHMFLTTKGWRSAKFLTRNMRIQSSLTNSLNTLMEACTDYGRARSILLKEESDCIERFGNLLMDQYLQIVTYITKTMIPLTTISGILNVYQKKSILNFLDLITKDFLLLLEIKQLNGIGQKLEDYGIKGWQLEPKDGPSGKEKQESAYFVNESMKQLFEEMGIHKNSATQTVKPLIIGGVRLLQERADVYCIQVPDVHHFSLSNGAIVHNSHYADAIRYLAISYKTVGSDISSADIDKAYSEAMHGHTSNLPKVFR